MTINDPLNGSTPPDVLEKALSGELARLAGAEGAVAPQEEAQPPADTPEEASAPQEAPPAPEPVQAAAAKPKS